MACEFQGPRFPWLRPPEGSIEPVIIVIWNQLQGIPVSGESGEEFTKIHCGIQKWHFTLLSVIIVLICFPIV